MCTQLCCAIYSYTSVKMAYALHWEYNMYNMVHCSPVFAQFFLFSFMNLCREPVFTLTPLLCIKNIYYCIFYDYYWFFTFVLPLTLFYSTLVCTCMSFLPSPLPVNLQHFHPSSRLTQHYSTMSCVSDLSPDLLLPLVPGILNSHRLTLPTTVLCRIYFYCTAP